METLILIKNFEDAGVIKETDRIIKNEILQFYTNSNLGFKLFKEKEFPKVLFYNLVMSVFNVFSSLSASIDEIWETLEVNENASYEDFKSKDLHEIINVNVRTIQEKTAVFGMIYYMCASCHIEGLEPLKNLLRQDKRACKIVDYFEKRIAENMDFEQGKKVGRNINMLNEWYEEVEMAASEFFRQIYFLSGEEKIGKLEEKIREEENEIVPNKVFIDKLKAYQRLLLTNGDKDYKPRNYDSYTNFANRLCEVVTEYYPNELEKTLTILQHLQYELDDKVIEKYKAILKVQKENTDDTPKGKGFDTSQMALLFYYLFVALGLRDERKTEWARVISEITG
ncbi:MAG: hypothetical protein K5860_06375, partial [Bacteroidales bacterium]|nr:hypothetical protein [Bacteroidales bacterium]